LAGGTEMNDHPTILQRVERYLAHRQGLGYGDKNVAPLLQSFAAHASQRNPTGPVTTSLAVEWAIGSKPLTPSTQAHRLSMVRTFARYCAAYDPRTEIPSQKLLGPARHRPGAYIYSPAEIEALLKAARSLRPANALRPHTYAALLGLMASTGIRVGEAIRLDLADVRWEESALVIRTSKQVRERWVPVHASTLDVLRAYAERRAVYVAAPSLLRFFINEESRPLTRNAIRTVFRHLRTVAGIGGKGKGQPRIHDLRHTFACRRLLRWHQEGVSIDEGMMSLSAYLGHVGPAHTYWYLTGIPELLDACGKRFEQQALRRMKGGRPS
jgi:integrase